MIENIVFQKSDYEKLIINNLMDCVVITDLKKNILFCNSSYANSTGYTIEELKERNYFDLVRKDYKEKEIIPKDSPQNYESVHIKKDGPNIHFLVRSIPVRDSNFEGYVFILRDITVYKAREKELYDNEEKMKHFAKQLAQAHDQLLDAKITAEAANKAKSMFLANMSHEIRSPMSSIIGFSEILNEEELDVEEVQEMAGIIMKNGRNLLDLINEILDLSKIEAGKIILEKRVIPLKKLTEEIISLLKIKVKEKNISLKLEYSDKLPETIVTDEVRLRQIIVNLIGNAIKFTSQGYIKLSCSISEDEVFAVFSVSDTGIGITKEKLKTIFEPFAQAEDFTTRKYGGTGLGLTITEKLVNLLGGKIRVDSEVGRGSTFHFTLPLVSSPGEFLIEEGEVKEEYLFEDELTGAQKEPTEGKILIVDDDEVSRKVIKKILLDGGYTVSEAESGEEALSSFQKEFFDFIIMDISMPVMDGMETTRKLRLLPEGENATVIGCSASIMDEDLEKFMEAGFDDYISKPINKEELLSISSKFMD